MRGPFNAYLGAALVVSLAVSAPGQAGLGKGRLTGVVVDEDGKPVVSARILIRFVRSPLGPGLAPTWRDESAVFETATDDKGVWAYNGLAGGIWEVNASKAGYDPSSRQVQVRQLSGNPHVKLRIDQIKEGVYSIAADLLERANELFAVGKLNEAIIFYRRFLRQDPEAVMVMLNLGNCLEEAGQLEEAIREYQALVDKTSANPLDCEITARALAGIGDCCFRKGDRENAIDYWKLAVEKSPTSEIVAAGLAETLFSVGKDREAETYYLKAIHIAPTSLDIRLKLAFVYLHLEEFDKARVELTKIIELQPGSEAAAQARKYLNEIAHRFPSSRRRTGSSSHSRSSRWSTSRTSDFERA